MPITPEQLAKSGTEHGEQVAFFAWAARAANNDPRLAVLRLMFAIPNGGQRGDGTKLGAKISGGRLKAEGVKEGVPDVLLPVPRICNATTTEGAAWFGSTPIWCGLFLELKRRKSVGRRKGVVAEAQTEMAAGLSEQGYDCRICYGWEEARAAVLDYLGVHDYAG